MATIIRKIFQTRTESYRRVFNYVATPYGYYHTSEIKVMDDAAEIALTCDGFIIFGKDCQWITEWVKVA